MEGLASLIALALPIPGCRVGGSLSKKTRPLQFGLTSLGDKRVPRGSRDQLLWQLVTGTLLTAVKPEGPRVVKGPIEEYDGWFWSWRCGQQGRLQGGGGV